MLQIQKLQTTVPKAKASEARKIADELLKFKYKDSGNPVFRKENISGGWQLVTKMKNENGEKVLSPVLIYTNFPASRLQYDERVVTIS